MTLYQETILDHYRNPRNYGTLPRATHHGTANNPMCGDKLQMDIIVKDGMIEDVRFSGAGCAISQAAASLLTEHVKHNPVSEALVLEPSKILELLGVTLSPVRMKCGLLSWETLKKTLNNKSSTFPRSIQPRGKL